MRPASPEQLEWAVRRFGAERAGRELRRRGLRAPIGGGTDIAIDASTPSAVLASSGGTATTASFTPPANSLLVCLLGSGAASNQSPGTPSNTGTAITFTAAVAVGGWNGTWDMQAQVYTGQCGANPGSITVSATSPSATGDELLLGVVVVVNALGVGATGTGGGNGIVSSQRSVSLSSLLGGGSMVLGVFADPVGTTYNPSPVSGQSVGFGAHVFTSTDSNYTFWGQRIVVPGAPAGSGVALTESGSSSWWAGVAVEILGPPNTLMPVGGLSWPLSPS